MRGGCGSILYNHGLSSPETLRPVPHQNTSGRANSVRVSSGGSCSSSSIQRKGDRTSSEAIRKTHSGWRVLDARRMEEGVQNIPSLESIPQRRGYLTNFSSWIDWRKLGAGRSRRSGEEVDRL